MKLGYVIIYVPEVEQSLRFFEDAFGLPRKFLHDSGTYGELSTGETTLGFASHQLAASNFGSGHIEASASARPLGMEIALVTDDVHAAHKRAIVAGATELAGPVDKAWGQVVSYVRCPAGTLIELCSPMHA